MIKAIVMRGVALFLFLSGALLFAQEMGNPRIEVKQERYDMGTIVQGKPAVHVFSVRNAGTTPLVIERLQTS